MILKKHLPSFLLYVGIAVFIMVASQFSSSESFTDSKLKIAVQDLDNTEASQALTAFLEQEHSIQNVDFDDKDKLLDKLYYRNVEYVLTIEDGFAKKLESRETDRLFSSSKLEDSYSATLLETQLQSIVLSAEGLIASGEGSGTAVAKAAEIQSKEIDVKVVSKDKTPDTMEAYLFVEFAYGICASLIMGISLVLSVMLGKNVENRTFASSYSSGKYVASVFSASIVLSLAVWLFFMILIVAKTGSGFFTSSSTQPALLNSLLFTVICCEIGILLSFAVRNSMAANIAANVISMGMAFLCGIFVEQSLLGDKVAVFSRFLPAYWYVKAASSIFSYGGESYSPSEIKLCMGIEALFAAALLAVIICILRKRRRQKEI